jgi:hypothetical protein
MIMITANVANIILPIISFESDDVEKGNGI